ncbi:NAD(P)-binding protein [Neurospora intermedia]|uniref:NAD(P)-binding protein n=1 Tax=Neurospora intermedia TaxID=5142 RepID=A0ABR3DBX6_NEUIN
MSSTSTPSAPAAFQKGNTALITGGASGIGLALAKRLLSHGLRVLIADKDISSLSSSLSSSPDLLTFEMDVSNLESWTRLKSHIDDVFNGQLNVLALNAGRYIPTSFSNADPTNFYETMQTNLFGVINGVTTLLPLVQATTKEKEDARGAVIITGSKQGITNPPANPAYNASKAAVKSLAEHLSFDLAKDHPDVSVHLLVPGWTFTGMTGATSGAQKEKEKPKGAWWPEQVVDYLEEKMKEGKFYAICPDNDVTEDMDKRRMVWAMGDVVENRPPLTRWRPEWKEKAEEGIKKLDI